MKEIRRMNDYESVGRYQAQMQASGWKLTYNNNGAAALWDHTVTGKRISYHDAQAWWWMSGQPPASEIGG